MREQKENFVETLIDTLKNPTRASIFFQLAKKPESTATEISKNLGEDVDVVYYHLKLLRKAGLISKPRVVIKGNYLEKYYSIRSDFKEKLMRSIEKLVVKEKELSPEEFRKMLIAFLTVIQSILASSIKRIEKIDQKIINKMKEEDNIESKIIFCTKERYVQLLSKLREIARGDILDTFNPIEKEYVILIVAVPKLNENQRNT